MKDHLTFFVFLDDPKRTCNALSKSLFIKRYSPTTSALSSWEGATGTCVFPFYWKGQRYDYCTKPNEYGGNGFCSFTTNYVGNGGWCTNECPLGRQICLHNQFHKKSRQIIVILYLL